MRKILFAALTLIMLLAFNVTTLAATTNEPVYYDMNGNQIKIDGMYYSSQGYPTFNDRCYYLNADGNPVYVGGHRAYYYNTSGMFTPCDYYYDANGGIVNRPTSYPGGWGCGGWYYDTDGNTITGTFYYDNSGKRIDPTIYYDERGNEITVNGMYYNNQGYPMFNAGCYYLDAKSNKVNVGGNRAHIYNSDGKLTAADYYYDTAGNAAERPSSFPGGWGCGGWYYDTDGNIVDGTFYYDNYGNRVDTPQNIQQQNNDGWNNNWNNNNSWNMHENWNNHSQNRWHK